MFAESFGRKGNESLLCICASELDMSLVAGTAGWEGSVVVMLLVGFVPSRTIQDLTQARFVHRPTGRRDNVSAIWQKDAAPRCTSLAPSNLCNRLLFQM